MNAAPNLRPNAPIDLFNESWGTTQIPYSQEAEEATLGAILLNASAFAGVSAFLRREDFYILRHQYIWEAFERCIQAGDVIDYITVIKALKDLKYLDEIGGAAYLTHLLNTTPTSVHVEIYARLVQRCAGRRHLMVASDHIKGLALNEALTWDEVAQEANAKVVAALGRTFVSQIESVSDVLSDYYGKIETAQNDKSETKTGVPTGIKALDNAIFGLIRGQVNVLAATSGTGKTTFALNVAINASRMGVRVGLFMLEMNRERAVNYMIGIETGIDPIRIELGQMTDAEWSRFVQATGNMSEFGKRIHIYERPTDADFRMTPIQLLAQCNALAYERGLDLVIVDYLGLMESGKQGLHGYDDKAYVSKCMPVLAQRLNLPILFLAQIPIKKLQKRKDHKPEFGDMEFVGENDVDVALYLHRPYLFDPTADPTEGEIIVGKARGRSFRGPIPMKFLNNKFAG